MFPDYKHLAQSETCTYIEEKISSTPKSPYSPTQLPSTCNTIWDASSQDLPDFELHIDELAQSAAFWVVSFTEHSACDGVCTQYTYFPRCRRHHHVPCRILLIHSIVTDLWLSLLVLQGS